MVDWCFGKFGGLIWDALKSCGIWTLYTLNSLSQEVRHTISLLELFNGVYVALTSREHGDLGVMEDLED